MNTAFTPSIQALILDMDGVLWRGDQLLGNLPAIFNEIKHRGLKVMLATNNATRSITQYLQKMSSHGVEMDDWQVINSAEATAHYLQDRYPSGGPVFVVGENGLQQTLLERGFYHSETDNEILAVVASMDRTLSYEKLSKATLMIRAGAEFIGTNPDRTFPDRSGILPGAGSILALLEAASEVNPTIIGKPAPKMYRIALGRLHTLPQQTLVVGDRLETDIAGGQALGCRCALVLSGVTSEVEAQKWKPAPDLIASDLTNLLHML
jgi:4-nitrophenyl phosphatase